MKTILILFILSISNYTMANQEQGHEPVEALSYQIVRGLDSNDSSQSRVNSDLELTVAQKFLSLLDKEVAKRIKENPEQLKTILKTMDQQKLKRTISTLKLWLTKKRS